MKRSNTINRRILFAVPLVFLVACGILGGFWVHGRSEVDFYVWQLLPQSLSEPLASPVNQQKKDDPRLAPYPISQLDFLNNSEVSIGDAYSASWLQPLNQFMAMNLETIGTLEDASFRAFIPGKHRIVRMTPDWLDLSVEHMSKWWKMLDIFRHEAVFVSLIQKLEAYLRKGSNYPIDNSLQNTIAVVPFMQIKDDFQKQSRKGYQLSKYTLAVTIESLRRAGFGRIVVAGLRPESEESLCQDTFRYWKSLVEQKMISDTELVTQVGLTEVVYAVSPMNKATSPRNKKLTHVPRAALWGLFQAFESAGKIRQSANVHSNETLAVQKWLGTTRNASYWKYVYFTEADSILWTRPTTLSMLQQQLETEPTVLIPHRLQPIPHQSDFLTVNQSLPPDYRYLSNATGSPFEQVMELDALQPQHDACCDEFRGPRFKPGSIPKPCGNFWYMCDFSKRAHNRTHAHLQHYALVRFTHGTGVVSLASQETGRRCIPQKGALCKAPSTTPDLGSTFVPFSQLEQL